MVKIEVLGSLLRFLGWSYTEIAFHIEVGEVTARQIFKGERKLTEKTAQHISRLVREQVIPETQNTEHNSDEEEMLYDAILSYLSSVSEDIETWAT